MLASILLFALFFQGGGQQQGQFPGQQQPAATPQSTPTAGTQGSRPQPQATPTPEEPPVVNRHSIRVGGQTLNNTATTGMMPIKNREGDVWCGMFFTSYVVDGPNRPLTFSFMVDQVPRQSGYTSAQLAQGV